MGYRTGSVKASRQMLLCWSRMTLSAGMKISRSLKSGFRLWIEMAAMVTFAFATGCRGQNVYTVGEGVTLWEVPPYPEFFQNWAAGLELYVNDSLYFTYDPTLHDVRVVQTLEELDKCETLYTPLGEDNSGDTLFKFASPGTFFLMSQADCNTGMKFQIAVWSPDDPNNGDDKPEASLTSPTQVPSAGPGPCSNDIAKSSVSHRSVTKIPWKPHAGDPNWANPLLPQPMEVDSYLVFEYSKTDNYSVYRVDENNYNLCNSSNFLETVDFGASVSLPQPGVYFYLDGNQSLCQNSNMKLLIDVPDPSSRKTINVTAIVISVVFIFLALVLAGFLFYRRYRRQTAHNRYHDRFVVYSRSYETKADKAKSSWNKNLLDNLYREYCGKQANKLLFTLKELELATRNFSRENELGSGAFGTVYKGNLRDGRVVAVKRANSHKAADVEQFVNEVSILSQVNHRNLVKLLGCCLDLKLPLLVYEFIPNGTLQDHLSLAQQGYSTKLNWPRRFNIALHTAEALRYLHSEAMPPIVHRDVKASNILLDDDFGAKVADFGLSKLVDGGVSHISTAIKGTPGYLDPEYCFNSQLTEKSDVYSYGIVLLELISSEKAIDLSNPNGQNLALRVVPLIKSKRIRDIIDRQLKTGLSKEEFEMVEAVAQVAVACLLPERVSRPTMSEVVEMLQRIRGSNLQAESFFIRDEATNEQNLPEDSLPFSNLSSIFHSFNWAEQSSSDVEAASHSLPHSTSFAVQLSLPNGGHNYNRDSFAPR